MDKLKILFLLLILSSNILTAQQWEPGSPINPLDVRDFAFNQEGNILCAVAGSVTGNFIKGAIFISTDQQTWRPFWDNPDQYALTSIAINNSGDIFAGQT